MAFGWTNECKFCIVTTKKGRLDLLQVVFYFSVIFQTRSTHCCPLLLGKFCIWFVSVQLFQRCCIAKTDKICLFSSPCQRQCELLPSLGVRRPSSVVCHPLTFHILIFYSENEVKLGRQHLWKILSKAILVSDWPIFKNLLLWNCFAKWTETW